MGINEDAVKKIVDQAPPLTPEQIDKLRVIFAPAMKQWKDKAAKRSR